MTQPLNELMVHHVLPQLESPFGFLRARACWMIQHFANYLEVREVSVTTMQYPHVQKTLLWIVHTLVEDGYEKELPVKIHAALTLQVLLEEEHGVVVRECLVPVLPSLIDKLLQLTRDTDMDDVASVVRDILGEFADELKPLAMSIATQLSDMIIALQKEREEEKEEKEKRQGKQ